MQFNQSFKQLIKNVIMKNLLKTLFAVLFFFSVYEASAQMSAGGGIVYGTNINNIGISVNGKYEINEKWSAAPAFTYFFKKDFVNWSALDLDGNYKLTEIENIGGLYAIGGLNLTFYKIKIDADLGEFGDYSSSVTGSNAGVNLGLGLNVPVGDNFIIAPEIKYSISNGSYLRAGVKFMFGI